MRAKPNMRKLPLLHACSSTPGISMDTQPYPHTGRRPAGAGQLRQAEGEADATHSRHHAQGRDCLRLASTRLHDTVLQMI